MTLNPNGGIDDRRVLRRFVYRHPLYTRAAIRAQRQLGRGERRQPDALLRRLLALRVSRRRVEFGAAGGRARSEWSGDRLGRLRRHAASSAVLARRARVHVSAVHGAARHRPHSRADAGVAADEPQPLELGEPSTTGTISAMRRARCASVSPPTRRPRHRSAGGADLPADTPAVSRLLLQSGLVLLLLRSRRAAAVVLAEVNNTFGGSHRYWLRPGSVRRAHFARRPPRRWTSRRSCRAILSTRSPSRRPAGPLVAHMETSRAGSVVLRCDAVARPAGLERGGDPAGACAVIRR